MATLAERAFRAEIDLQLPSPAQTSRFLCGCRDCAFRQDEQARCSTVSLIRKKDLPAATHRMPASEEV